MIYFICLKINIFLSPRFRDKFIVDELNLSQIIILILLEINFYILTI